MTAYAFLEDFALLRFQGADALSFLQGQLSQDMHLVRAENALLASYSNPKGRVFATFLCWQDTQVESSYYALLKKDIAEFLQKRLRMFVLRAKVSIELVPATIQGFWGESLADSSHTVITHLLHTNNIAISYFSTDMPSGIPTFNVLPIKGGFAILSLVEKTQRVLLLSIDNTKDPIAEVNTSDLLSTEAAWQVYDILAGIPWIGDKTKEHFIAQSINLDAIGAINFKKGCYPGQEVIARSHYLGQLKRRSMIGVIAHNITNISTLIGSDVMLGDQPVGQVINASHDNDKTYLLFEVQLSAVNQGPLSLALIPQATIQVKQVPYPLNKPE